MKQLKYTVGGMHCAACSSRVERTALSCPGVKEAAVNLVRGTLVVRVDEASFSSQDLCKRIQEAGYSACEQINRDVVSRPSREGTYELLATVLLAVLLFVLAMGGGKLNIDPLVNGLSQIVLAATVFLINRRHWTAGVSGLVHRAPTMDTLVALGSSASFLFSLTIVISSLDNSHALSTETLSRLYFDSAAMIYAFVGVGKWLEGKARDKTASSLEALAGQIPHQAVRLVGEKTELINARDIQPGDVLFVRAGDAIAADGIVVCGGGQVDESSLTGESLPREIRVGDSLFCSTHVVGGWVHLRVTHVGTSTRFAQILNLVDSVTESKAPIERVADKVSAVFVPIVIALSILTFVLWLLFGYPTEFSLINAICVLVISCPCALGLATPVAVTIAGSLAARNGVFFKNAAALEEMSRIDTAVLDKTGTLTRGEFSVNSVSLNPSYSIDQVLSWVLSVESFSTHPLAKALCRYAEERGAKQTEATDFHADLGYVRAKIGSQVIEVGNPDALSITPTTLDVGLFPRKSGQTVLYLRENAVVCAAFALSDTLKDSAAPFIATLKKFGIKIYLASGDSESVVQDVRKKLGITHATGAMTPEGKEALVEKLHRQGRHVLFVGDGINDAPSLVRADVGMAVGAGTHVAMDSADVVLVSSHLSDIASALSLSRVVMRNIRQNLFWAFFYNVLGIPLAAGVLYPICGWHLSPMFAAAAMSLSSLCVVGNAMRLFAWHPEAFSKTDAACFFSSEKVMRTQLRIDGMHCEHCAKAASKALRTLPGVTEVFVDLAGKTALVESTVPLEEAAARAALKKEDFTLVSVQKL